MQGRDKAKKKPGAVAILLRGTALAVAVCGALLLASAALVAGGTLAQENCDAVILACVLLATAASGAYAAGKNKGGVVVSGLKAAALMVIICLIGSLINREKAAEGALTLRLIIACAVGGTFGGVLKLHRNGKKAHRKI